MIGENYNLPGDEANTAGGGKGGDKETESLASTLHPAPVTDNHTSFFLLVNFHIRWGSRVGCVGGKYAFLAFLKYY